jgi:hypothetical protein
MARLSLRRLGLLVGVGVIAALGVLSFRALLTSVNKDAGPDADARARPSSPARPDADEPRSPVQGEAASELEESNSAESQRLDGIAAGEPSPPVSSNRASADNRPEPRREPQPSTETERPLGWCFFTTLDHEFASDSEEVWNGSRSVVIREAGPVAESAYKVNALWQAVDATPYRNSRVEIVARVKSRGGVFVFLHGVTNPELLLTNNQLRVASSNNQYFGAVGDNWARLAIVGDIQSDADVVYFGVAQNGSAPLWADDFRITKVGASTPITATASQNAPLFLYVSSSGALAQPTNLDFEITNADAEDGAPSAADTPC